MICVEAPFVFRDDALVVVIRINPGVQEVGPAPRDAPGGLQSPQVFGRLLVSGNEVPKLVKRKSLQADLLRRVG